VAPLKIAEAGKAALRLLVHGFFSWRRWS
jgi:hypothetical protein